MIIAKPKLIRKASKVSAVVNLLSTGKVAMHLAEDWFISFTTTVLCMFLTSASTQGAWFGEKDVVLLTIESKRTTAKSVAHCAFR